MGSVAERVVRMASCPVLTARTAGHHFVRPDVLVQVANARRYDSCLGPWRNGPNGPVVHRVQAKRNGAS